MGRPIKTEQISLRALFFVVDGTLATPAASGFDQYQISSVQDLAVGRYKINFLRPFERSCQLAGFGMLTADTSLVVEAIDSSSITINSIDMAGTNVDAKFSLHVIGSDARYDV